MLTRKNCSICDSPWHSKNKCPKRENKPLKAVYKAKGTDTPLSPESGSNRPRLAYKGNSERSQLIGYADKFFSLYVRTRGGDGMYNHCYTCLHKHLITELQCGHYMRRDYFMTRWNEMNCNPQCNDCNVVKHGNLEVYRTRLVAEYGESMVEGLEQLARRSGKVTIPDIKEVVEKYNGVVF